MLPEKEQWIEETLSSIDGISRAELNPYFKTRIHEALKKNQSTNEIPFFKAAAVAALSLILLFINVLLFSSNTNKETSISDTAVSSYNDFTYENSVNPNTIFYYDDKQ